ncbi:MAG: hypothetical protein M3Y56_14035 [Armatimonadota bacterium]|nr:hypothetical protein [Armatimonadota bacterium]
MEQQQTMNIFEIWSQFPGEWVLLGEPQTNEALEVLGGKVLWHGPDRDELHRCAMKLRLRRSAVLYTGKLAADMEFVV